MEGKLTRSGISLKLVMDQSVYVRKSIEALVQEGLLGAVLCSLVILIFLGQWRMTAIAILTLPISVLAAIAALSFHGPDDQYHDPRRTHPGDRTIDRYVHHLPREYPPPPEQRDHSPRGCIPGHQ